MLREKLLMAVKGAHAVLMLASLLGSGLAGAQSISMPFTPRQSLSAKDKAQFASILDELQQAARTAADSPQIQADVSKISRQAETIANPAMQRDREKLLKFLGINPQGATQLYIFVSWSMPLPMLRAYEIESMWTGAPLVFRGIPQGTTLQKFILHDLRELVWGKGAGADIAIDPRLFDLYSVSSVPSIVLTKRVSQFACALPETFSAGKAGILKYTGCSPLSPSEFVKVEGGVTTAYALREFEQNGWPQASIYLTALRKGYTNGIPDSPRQMPFAGKWNLVPFPKPPTS